MTALLTAALAYARAGYPVLPLRGKAPRTPRGCKDATTAPSVIRARWATWPDAGIGVRTGKLDRGGYLVVLDVDGQEGADSLHALEREHGELPATPTVLTGRGCHYWMHSRSPVPSSAGKLGGPGLDTRGCGGYVAAPPSVHPSGRAYCWDVALEDAPLAELPGWIGELLDPPRRNAPEARRGPLSAVADALAAIPPPAYFAALTGRTPNRAGKVCCPLPGHRDSDPSCHVYDDPERGWYCHGCQRGGAVYDLAALLAGYPLPLRGADFLRVRGVLLEHFATEATA